jgi:hypothetical protein
MATLPLTRLPTHRGITKSFSRVARHFSVSSCWREIKDIQSLAPRILPLYKGVHPFESRLRNIGIAGN